MSEKNSGSINISEYAFWYTRAAAQIIDGLIVGAVQFIITSPILLIISFSRDTSSSVLVNLLQIVFQILGYIFILGYFGYFQSKNGATPGQKFLGIKVIKEDGTYLSFGYAVLRVFLFTLLSIINIIMILFTEKKQGVHDLATGSVTVKDDEKTSRAKWVIGFYCGCGCLALIASLAIMSIIGYSAFNSKTILNSLEKSKDNTSTDLNSNFDYNNTMDQKEQVTPITSDNTQSTFYKACVDANKNPNIDLADYCVCAEKEYNKGSSLDKTVENCKDLIQIK